MSESIRRLSREVYLLQQAIHKNYDALGSLQDKQVKLAEVDRHYANIHRELGNEFEDRGDKLYLNDQNLLVKTKMELSKLPAVYKVLYFLRQATKVFSIGFTGVACIALVLGIVGLLFPPAGVVLLPIAGTMGAVAGIGLASAGIVLCLERFGKWITDRAYWRLPLCKSTVTINGTLGLVGVGLSVAGLVFGVSTIRGVSGVVSTFPKITARAPKLGNFLARVSAIMHSGVLYNTATQANSLFSSVGSFVIGVGFTGRLLTSLHRTWTQAWHNTKAPADQPQKSAWTHFKNTVSRIFKGQEQAPKQLAPLVKPQNCTQQIMDLPNEGRQSDRHIHSVREDLEEFDKTLHTATTQTLAYLKEEKQIDANAQQTLAIVARFRDTGTLKHPGDQDLLLPLLQERVRNNKTLNDSDRSSLLALNAINAASADQILQLRAIAKTLFIECTSAQTVNQASSPAVASTSTSTQSYSSSNLLGQFGLHSTTNLTPSTAQPTQVLAASFGAGTH